MNYPASNALADISAVKEVELPIFSAENGELIVMEALIHVPFKIARLFLVHAPAGSIRGRHAHRACSQFLTSPVGNIEVVCYDGKTTATFLLNRPNIGLLVPPGIWAEQNYLKPDSILSVLCDQLYDEGDYIRDAQKFQDYRNGRI